MASAFGVVFLVLVAIAFISNWSDISEALSEADWSRLPLTVVLAGLTYVAGALSLMGSVLRPLPLGRTTIVMFGQSFLNRFTPDERGRHGHAGPLSPEGRDRRGRGRDSRRHHQRGQRGHAGRPRRHLRPRRPGNSPGGAIDFPDISIVAVVVVVAALFIGLVITVIPSAASFATRWLKIGWARLGGRVQGPRRSPGQARPALRRGRSGQAAHDHVLRRQLSGLRHHRRVRRPRDAVPDRQHRWRRRADAGRRRRRRSRPHRRPDRRRRRQRDGRGRRRHLPAGHLLAPGRARATSASATPARPSWSDPDRSPGFSP